MIEEPGLRLGGELLFGKGDAYAIGGVVGRSIVLKVDDDIIGGSVSDFGEETVDDQWGGEYPLKLILEKRAESEIDESSEKDVLRGTLKSLRMRGLDGGLAQFFDIDGVSQSAVTVVIIDLENF